MRWAAAGALLLGALGTAPGEALAQFGPRRAPRRPAFEVGVGVTWTPSITGPSRSAELTRNGQDAGGFDLFRFASEIENGPGVGTTLSYHLTRAVAIEAGLRFSKPRLSYRLTGDAESAADTTAGEVLTRYVFTGSVLFHLRRVDGPGGFVPFVAAGGGYIRDLHQRNELLETGREYHALGGVKYFFGTGRRRLGLRGQAGVSMTDGGFDFRESSRTTAIAAAGVTYLF